MDEYDIPIYGIKDGIHNYEYTISTGFFDFFENPDLPAGQLDLNVIIKKSSQILELNFLFSGTLKLICDRCLEFFDYKVEFEEKLFVRFGDDFEELDDNIIVIPREESRINIAQYIYEFTALSVPYKKVHPDNEEGKSGCKPEMLKILNELKVDENNQPNTSTDPRWDKLKNLN
jgi:uncharacterized metal-binding protein YceD (DUF177 family)